MALQQQQSTQTDIEDLRHPSLYINRELSWLEFNQRVLDQALDPSKPWLERLKFLIIVSTNLDEFFRIRVAGVQRQLGSQPGKVSRDGMTAEEQLAAIDERARRMIREQRRCLLEEVLPALARRGIRLRSYQDLDEAQRDWLHTEFHRQVFPVLTPLAPREDVTRGQQVEPPPEATALETVNFPHVRNRTVNLLVMLGDERAPTSPPLAVVEVPDSLPRLFRLPGPGHDYVLLDEVIRSHIGELFPGRQVRGCHTFCLSRDADLELDEEVEDLLETLQEELRKREWGGPVRIEVSASIADEALERLRAGLGLQERQIYRLAGPIRLQDLMLLFGLPEFSDLRYPAYTPPVIRPVQGRDDLFGAIRERDLLLHHPYESFETVMRLLDDAAADPDVLAIKQTLYRTSGDSPIVSALARAARNGKQVTVVIELRARFDEARNIGWAHQLEDAGAHVVFGPPGLKAHCKALLIVRREDEEGQLRRYVHLGTGNYHPATARLYTDLGLLTCRPEFGEDVSRLFNLLTGKGEAPDWQVLTVAPHGLRQRTVELIDREAALSSPARPGRIVARLNQLEDPETIQALYRASQAAVRIHLIVRGVCCLRPGRPGVSENITVTSIVGRFLEHSRAFYFQNGGDEEVYLSSADWMRRNFDRRIETMFPVLDPRLRDRLRDEIIGVGLADTEQAYSLRPDGLYDRVCSRTGEPAMNSQDWFIVRALAEHGEVTTEMASGRGSDMLDQAELESSSRQVQDDLG